MFIVVDPQLRKRNTGKVYPDRIPGQTEGMSFLALGVAPLR